MAKPPETTPFPALAILRGQVLPHAPGAAGRTGPSTAQPGSSNPASTDSPATAGDDDTTLFHQAMAGTQALRTPPRAEIQRPKPAPLPRPRAPERAEESTAPARAFPPPDDGVALFRYSVGDVTPLKDSGRADIGHAKPRHRPMVPQDKPFPPGDHDLLALPSLAHYEHDPATLFRHVVGTVAPLADKNRVEPNRPLPPPKPLKREQDEANVLREALEAPLSFQDRLDIGDESAFLREGLARRVLTDLRRGRWVIQRELDLHGNNRDEARAELGHFLAEALDQGLRCVRIIHGKGHGSPGRISILKQLSRGWLMQRNEILAFCQARPHDGGDGALMVLLRSKKRIGASLP